MFDLIPHFPKGCTVPEPKAQMCWLNFLGWNFPTRKENFWATKYYHCFHALVFYFATETHPVDLVWSITLFRLDQMCMVGKGFQRSLWSKNHYPPCKNQAPLQPLQLFYIECNTRRAKTPLHLMLLSFDVCWVLLYFSSQIFLFDVTLHWRHENVMDNMKV